MPYPDEERTATQKVQDDLLRCAPSEKDKIIDLQKFIISELKLQIEILKTEIRDYCHGCSGNA